MRLERSGGWTTDWSNLCTNPGGRCRQNNASASDRVSINGARQAMVGYLIQGDTLKEIRELGNESPLQAGQNVIHVRGENLFIPNSGVNTTITYWPGKNSLPKVLCQGALYPAGGGLTCSANLSWEDSYPQAGKHGNWKNRYEVIEPQIKRDPGIPDPDEVQKRIAKSLNACNESIRKMAETTLGRDELREDLAKAIHDSIAQFDRTKAAQLEGALRNLSDFPADRAAELGCAVEAMAEATNKYQNQNQCASQESCTAKDLARASFDRGVTELTNAARSGKGSALEFQERMETQNAAREIGIALLDLATSFTPGISAGRDAYEAITGYNLISGEELSKLDRAMAALSLASLGAGGAFKGTFNAIRGIADTAKEGGRIAEGVEATLRAANKITNSALNFKPTGEVSKLFSTPEKALEHFSKHGRNIKQALGETTYDFGKYMADANHTIKNGTYVSEKNAYVRLIGGNGEKAKYAFVGQDRETGAITTFHVKYVTELIKEAPSLGLSR